MKKLSYLFAALLMSVTVFVSSCTDDGTETDPGPSLTLKGGAGYTSDDAVILIGSTVKVGVVGGKSSVSGNKLTRFKFIFTSNNIPTTLLDTTLNTDSFNWETEIEFNSIGTGRLSFELTDKGNMMTEKGFNITVQGPETKKWTNVELGSWNDDIGSFFSSSEGFTYTVTQTFNTPANQSKIDFLFFKGVTYQNTIASPDDVDANTINDLKLTSWTNKNQTRFNPSSITAAQFDAIGANYQFPAFDLGQVSTKMAQLEPGDVFLFKTATNKVGLVKVISTYTKGDKMKIDVVMEK
jgi:hypothetical protein